MATMFKPFIIAYFTSFISCHSFTVVIPTTTPKNLSILPITSSSKLSLSSFSTTSHPTAISDNPNNSNDNNCNNLQTFIQCLQSMSLPPSKQNEIIDIVQNTLEFTSSNEIYIFAIDFIHRPEVLSQILMKDFGISVTKSHLIRGCLMRLVEIMDEENGKIETNENEKYTDAVTDTDTSKATVTSSTLNDVNVDGNDSVERSTFKTSPTSIKSSNIKDEKQITKQPLFKSVIVNTKAKKRKMTQSSKTSPSSSSALSSSSSDNYGLAPNYKKIFPTLSQELDEFLLFMIQPSTKSSQESPIRKATATVYIRHAKLFLGWWTKYQYDQSDLKNNTGTGKILENISIYDIFPNDKATTAQPVIDFILWLRKNRDISSSYEANMLRGLTKLLKFRFCHESESDPSYGEKSFADIQAVRELRKLHRDANRRQILSPRSSEEDRKWLDWNEFLDVIKAVKDDLSCDINQWEEEEEKRLSKCQDKKSNGLNRNRSGNSYFTSTQRRIATKFQAYLILAFFSCVPDRQRTFRELELDKTFLKDESINCWIIKHGPDDYKTGSTYGDRPPLVIAEELTPAIDVFLSRWRQCLSPNGQHFFVQPRTGNAFTQDTVYSLVARSCYKYKGKKTNPHLLRDMIVTKIRDSNASEKELEALALYMGHSINMQRTSYDRRTLTQKVAPAVQLLQNVNSSVNKEII